MAGCCSEDDGHIAALRTRQRQVLWAVLALNATMFVVEFGAGWLASSAALLGDSLDMLGDALVYGLSLFVVARSPRWKAVSAGCKGAVMLAFGLLVLGEAVHKALYGTTPEAGLMAVVGVLALAANVACLWLLTRHRDDDVNMGSAWVCSRNDLVANSSVLIAAALVAATGSLWPDVIVGAGIALLFLVTALGVLRDAWRSVASADGVNGSAKPATAPPSPGAQRRQSVRGG